ncbi:MAG: hypothetical protein JWN61_358 [Pseudonocardiales bacterium]|nr:hypothetical protein [Pseudonocardiales bacterium]
MAVVTTWTWRFEDAEGGALSEPAPETFGSRADAESWIGENWPEVAALGVVQVQLLGAGAPVGKRMILK